MLLEVDGLSAGYGSGPVLNGISLSVGAGEVVALLGANGAGKTSCLRVLSGLLRPSGGQVLLDGEPLTALPAHALVSRGVAHVPEGRRVFARLSVRENLETGAYARRGPGALERVLALFPVLADRAGQVAGTLSGGEQQQLALGRALMSGPRLVLLDEPSTGLAPQAVQAVLAVVRQLAVEGVGVLLVEQDAGLALRTAGRAVVLETGRVVAAGTPQQVRPLLGAAYLGDT